MFFAFAIIGDFLFAQSPDQVSATEEYHLSSTLTDHVHHLLQFPTFVDQLPRFKRLLKEPASFWVALIEKYFVKGHKIAVSWTW